MKQLKPAILEYIQFLSLSRQERRKNYGYETQKDFAKDHKITEVTLGRWAKLDGFKAKLKEFEEKILNKPEDKMRQIFEELELKAMGGESKSIELYMKNIDLITETLHAEIPTWEVLIDKIDMIEQNKKFRKKIMT